MSLDEDYDPGLFKRFEQLGSLISKGKKKLSKNASVEEESILGAIRYHKLTKEKYLVRERLSNGMLVVVNNIGKERELFLHELTRTKEDENGA